MGHPIDGEGAVLMSLMTQICLMFVDKLSICLIVNYARLTQLEPDYFEKWLQSGLPKVHVIFGCKRSPCQIACHFNQINILHVWWGFLDEVFFAEKKYSAFAHYGFDNYVPQWWVEFNNEFSWLFTNRFSATSTWKLRE